MAVLLHCCQDDVAVCPVELWHIFQCKATTLHERQMLLSCSVLTGGQLTPLEHTPRGQNTQFERMNPTPAPCSKECIHVFWGEVVITFTQMNLFKPFCGGGVLRPA
eukprot:635940-Amphidinium_carterae.1